MKKGTPIQQVRANSHGEQLKLSVSITPTKPKNIIFIEAFIWGNDSSLQTYSLFQNFHPNALAHTNSPTKPQSLKTLIHSMNANTTSEITFTIRGEPNSSNRTGERRLSSLIITEYET